MQGLAWLHGKGRGKGGAHGCMWNMVLTFTKSGTGKNAYRRQMRLTLPCVSPHADNRWLEPH